MNKVLDTGVNNVRNVSRYIFGQNCLAKLAEILSTHCTGPTGHTVYFVDSYFRENGSLIDRLPIEESDQVVFVSTVDEPTTDLIDTMCAQILSERSTMPRAIVGVGGGITLDTQYQGLTKGMFSKEGLVFVQASGEGDLLVNGFGRISSVDVSGGITIDNGHLIAFTEGLEYTISKAGSGWISSMMSGEGLVMNFRGQGKVLVQSHDPSRLGGVLGPLLPPRES